MNFVILVYSMFNRDEILSKDNTFIWKEKFDALQTNNFIFPMFNTTTAELNYNGNFYQVKTLPVFQTLRKLKEIEKFYFPVSIDVHMYILSS